MLENPEGCYFKLKKTQPSDLSLQSGHSAGTKSLSLVRLQQSEGPVHDKQAIANIWDQMQGGSNIQGFWSVKIFQPICF